MTLVSTAWIVGLILVVWTLDPCTTRPSLSHAQVFQQAAPTSGPRVGRPAIAFALKTLEGQSLTLENFRGKPLVLNFFASWCDPCREEMPLINEIASRAIQDGYHVLGIAVEDTRAAVSEFAQASKLLFPIALDLNSSVRRSYRLFGPPATFFIDSQGVIRDIVLGPMTAQRAFDALNKTGVAAKKIRTILSNRPTVATQ